MQMERCKWWDFLRKRTGHPEKKSWSQQWDKNSEWIKKISKGDENAATDDCNRVRALRLYVASTSAKASILDKGEKYMRKRIANV